MTLTVSKPALAFKMLPTAANDAVAQTLAILEHGEDARGQTTRPRRFKEARWQALSDHFRFCVLRDPAERLMDLYATFVDNRDVLESTGKLPDDGRFPPVADADYFFTYLDAYRSRSALVNHHAMSAAFFLGRDLSGNYDRVFRDTELRQVSRMLSRRSGQIVRVGEVAVPQRRLQLEDLLDETIDSLRPYLDAEYEYLNAYFANPLGARIHAACAVPR